MDTISTVKARESFSDLVKRSAYGKERIVLTRRGKGIAAVIPIEDLKLLEEIEDRLDVEDAREALREPGSIPWEKVKTDLGLQMGYAIELKPAAVRALAKLPKDAQKAIRFRTDALSDNPLPPKVKKLEGEENLYRIRVGDYRIVYQLQKEIPLILVVKIGHRKEVYRRMQN